MTPGDVVAVRLRVVWVAGRSAAPAGRVVVQRTTTGDGGPPAFWLSGPMTAAALVGATRGGRPAGWHDLLLGLPVGELSAPVPLRPAARADLDELSDDLARSDAVAIVQRPLLLAAAELVGGTAVSARVVRFAGDVLAHAFDGVLDGPPPGLVLGKTTVEGAAVAAYEAGTRLAVDAWIPVADVAAARPVEGRGRVTTLVLEPAGGRGWAPGTAPDGALAGLLGAAPVRELVAAVGADPGNEPAREALAAALAGPGRSVRAGSSTIDVGGAGVERIVELLDGLVLLVVRNTSDLQDPDGHDPDGHDPDGHDPDGHDPDGGDRVGLVGPTRAASTLLRSHERLAVALADHLAAPAGPGGAAAHIRRRRELRAALQAAAAATDA